MVDVPRTAAVAAAALLVVLAVAALASGRMLQAGLLFLSASLTIYLREKRL